MNDPVARFLAMLQGVRASGKNQWTALCPAHPDEHPSLSVRRGDDDCLLVKCFAGCCFESILASVGWKSSDSFPDRSYSFAQKTRMKSSRNGRAFPSQDAAIANIAQSTRGRHTMTWTYHDATGHESFAIARFDGCKKGKPKEYRPLYHAVDGWHINDPPGLLPLYGLPQLVEAAEVWVCEGEKCCDLFREFGFVATTNAHGAQAVEKSDWSTVAGKRVNYSPDRGAAGEAHTKKVLEQLSSLTPAPTVKVIHLPVYNDGDDIEQLVEGRRAEGASDEQIRQEIEQLAQAAAVIESEPGLISVRLSDVVPEEQPYLWRGRIPSSSCTLIGGRQGGTKNFFAYDLMARVTNGTPWPNEGPGMVRNPQNVILLEAEEHLESSIVPRLAAAGADLSRIQFVKGAPTENRNRNRLISIQNDSQRIEALARQIGDVALIVVSPITSYLGSVEQNRNEQVRNEIIHPLKMLAERIGCAVVIIKHPNKDCKNNDPLERISGSTAWTEAMRCVIFIGKDPDEPEDEANPRRCAHWVKFSIGSTPEPLSWKLHKTDSGAPAVCYSDDKVTFSAEEMLLGRRKAEERKSKREHATEWITKTLESGPQTAIALNDAALATVNRDRLFSMDAFEKARKDLRDSGRLEYERKPEVNPAEWWYWIKDQRPPDWYVSSSTSAESRAHAKPP